MKCKHCTTSISPSNNSLWYKVCRIFFFARRLDFRFGPFGFFSVFYSIRRSDFGFGFEKMWRLGIDVLSIASRKNIPAYRPGDPGVFHSRCQGLWTHVTLLGLTQTQNFLRSAPHILLNFCKRRTQFNKKHSYLMRCLCDFFFYYKA